MSDQRSSQHSSVQSHGKFLKSENIEPDLITQVKKSQTAIKTANKRVYKPETDFVKKLKSN